MVITAIMFDIRHCTFFGAPNDCFGGLSQRFNSHFTCDGDHFATVEDFVLFTKAQVFGDSALAARIRFGAYVHPPPGTTTEVEVKNFNEEVWDQYAFATVVLVNLCKFTQDKKLRETLLATGDTVLVEINPNDKVWDVGYSKLGSCDRYATSKPGIALMCVRDLIRERLERGVEDAVMATSELPEMDTEVIVKAYSKRMSSRYLDTLVDLWASRKG
jgi:ribA/ribD-fused uncharacterized protein